ncbi:Primosome PriB/single-strand DNA-binding [Macleaya cordata]|uniref:Primosome PriB/single-strand DNA-binding n=1 Tax=Macleaya cordata TaxID=56857 RepID=A0A200QU85_MACCD|nr:Primosome PriB/single-strand DNA-binding [Macleaya cordata]
MKTLTLFQQKRKPWRSCLVDQLCSGTSLQNFLGFSSSSAASHGFSSFFSGQSNNEGSFVYQHKLLSQRPTTIKLQKRLQNSISFIGSVVFPLKTVNTSSRFGVHTMLQVRSSKDSDRTFLILLKMWDKMAEISLKHLKQKDYIFVSGQLGSYKKVDSCGNERTFFEVTVEELNYVAHNLKNQTSKSEKSEDSESKEGVIATASSSDVEKKADNLYLWHVFFANPFEWWDNRQRKTNPRQSDFRHKDTGEVLWLDPRDPPWIRRQLQLHDSRVAEQGLRGLINYPRSRVSVWTYED